MPLEIRATDTKMTDDMRKVIEHRMVVLSRMTDEGLDGRLELRARSSRPGLTLTTAHLTVMIGKRVLRAKRTADTPKMALIAVFDSLSVKVRRERVRRDHGAKKPSKRPRAKKMVLRRHVRPSYSRLSTVDPSRYTFRSIDYQNGDKHILLPHLAVEKNPLSTARMRAYAVRERLAAAEGGLVTSESAAQALVITQAEIETHRKNGELIGVQYESHVYSYPAWQFTNARILTGLKDVLSALSVDSPWVQIAFMLNDNAWLNDRRPLDALRAGEVDAVIDAARQYGEQSAA